MSFMLRPWTLKNDAMASHCNMIAMRNRISRILMAVVLLGCCAVGSAQGLFGSMLGKSKAEVTEHLDMMWRHFFTPADLSRFDKDGEKGVYYETSDGLAFIMDTGSNDVRTEGMSYGMMISVQLDKRDVFDKLWQWSKRYMAYPKDSAWDGYFCWQCDTKGNKIGTSNASDGELYYVTALLLASERWGEPRYAEEANTILDKVMSKDGRKTGVYNLFNKDNYLITFVPDRVGSKFTDPSYMLPAFLDKWSRSAQSNREFWKKAATAARQHLIDAAGEMSIYPDYSTYEGKPYRWNGAEYDTSIYMYDAQRCPMNVGMDYYLCGADKERQQKVLRKWLQFVKKDGFKHSHFNVNGKVAKVPDNMYGEGMAGADAVAAYALADSEDPADKALARELVQRLWDTPMPTGKYRYYAGMVMFLSQLHVAGMFKLDFTGHQSMRDPNVKQTPYQLRLLNHWDNPNGTIERGYAGRSIFWIPGGKVNDDVIREYGRRNQTVGINGTVLNNVNAKPEMLSTEKLLETKHIADLLRPYGLKVYLSVNFASPKALGGLATADPLNADVKKWWKEKADEIYRLIPDFGGFLVKANSEGEPGPMDYGRTHVDGANMLAEALRPHNGIVMWRAFVYSATGGDRASQAYEEFMPFDGLFSDNVIIQIKIGPVDFQPTEPLSPLFYGLKKTKMMVEVQLTQEYTGESIHTCFMPNYMMPADLLPTTATNHPSANIVGIAGVSNVGDNDWCGSIMAQANWYAFGRYASEPTLTKEQIAREWLSKTFTPDTAFVNPMTKVLVDSHDAVKRYMMPLGLHHIFAGGHHYGPEPWCDPKGWREDWKPRYYHKAAKDGIGFDRTLATGTKNTRLYPDTLYNIYENAATCPDELLLWFHHLPWNYRMRSGETLWNELCHQYDQGVREAQSFADTWKRMRPFFTAADAASNLSPERFADQERNFDRQAKDAVWWRDACLLYFQQFSGMKLPKGSPKPQHKLEDLMKFQLRMDNYTRADINKLP